VRELLELRAKKVVCFKPLAAAKELKAATFSLDGWTKDSTSSFESHCLKFELPGVEMETPERQDVADERWRTSNRKRAGVGEGPWKSEGETDDGGEGVGDRKKE